MDNKKTIFMLFLFLISMKFTTFAAQDAIDILTNKLANDRMWMNGEYPLITLPESAKPAEVIEECFKNLGFDKGHVKTYQIKEIRKIRIPGLLPDDYLAVLVGTDLGSKIILLQYQKLNWWTRVYDTPEIIKD